MNILGIDLVNMMYRNELNVGDRFLLGHRVIQIFKSTNNYFELKYADNLQPVEVCENFLNTLVVKLEKFEPIKLGEALTMLVDGEADKVYYSIHDNVKKHNISKVKTLGNGNIFESDNYKSIHFHKRVD